MDAMLWLQRLTRWARLFTRWDAEADDLVMEALHACRRHFGSYPWEAPPEAHPQLLGRCQRKVRSLAIDHNRRAWVCHELLLVDTPVGESLACRDDTEAMIEPLAVEQFIGSLPPYLRVVAELYEAGYNIGDATTRGYSEMAVSTARMTGSGTEAPSQAV